MFLIILKYRLDIIEYYFHPDSNNAPATLVENCCEINDSFVYRVLHKLGYCCTVFLATLYSERKEHILLNFAGRGSAKLNFLSSQFPLLFLHYLFLNKPNPAIKLGSAFHGFKPRQNVKL